MIAVVPFSRKRGKCFSIGERPEDQLKAVEWAREQKKKILDDKSRRIADALMEKMTPLIMKNGTQK